MTPMTDAEFAVLKAAVYNESSTYEWEGTRYSIGVSRRLLAKLEADAVDAYRYRWMRAQGGEALDAICDDGISKAAAHESR